MKRLDGEHPTSEDIGRCAATPSRRRLPWWRATTGLLVVLGMVSSSPGAWAGNPDDIVFVKGNKGRVALPYPLDNVFRGFARCRRGRHTHKALDIGGVGPDWGVGTPIRSIAKARVMAVRKPEDNPARFGTRLKNISEVTRGKKSLPTSKVIEGYGRVYFFTADYGSSRTGEMITTKVLEGRLKGYTVRYMHLGATHPKVKPGHVVEAGQEIGLMGGTAVQEDAPHLHIDISSRSGRAIDVGPVFGIGRTRVSCSRGKRAELALRQKYAKAAHKLMYKKKREHNKHHRSPRTVNGCGTWTEEGDFKSGRFESHIFDVLPTGASRRKPWTFQLERLDGARWQPKLVLEDAYGTQIYSGSGTSAAKKRAYRIKRLPARKPGVAAVVSVKPRKDIALRARVAHWGSGKPSRKATYRLTVTRPCPR